MQSSKLSELAVNIISLKPLFFKTLGKVVPFNSVITPGGYYAMLFISKHTQLSMSELGKLLAISKPNVSAMVNKLMDNGFVVRSSGSSDRRIIMISLSVKGLQFVEKHKKKYLFQIEKKLSSLPDEELKLFSESIQNVKDILSKLSELESD
jgi:DNA-binding MarR family transcriptional regulator